jgi:hypothetical protein
LASVRPRYGAYFAAIDLSEPPLGFLDPSGLDLVGGLADTVDQPKQPYLESQSYLDATEPRGNHYYWKTNSSAS